MVALKGGCGRAVLVECLPLVVDATVIMKMYPRCSSDDDGDLQCLVWLSMGLAPRLSKHST